MLNRGQGDSVVNIVERLLDCFIVDVSYRPIADIHLQHSRADEIWSLERMPSLP